MKKRVSTLLIAVGVLVAAYPLLDRAFTWYMQWQIEQTYAELDDVFINEAENTGGDIGTPSAIGPEPAVTTASEPAAAAPEAAPAAEAQPQAEAPAKPVPKPIAILRIPKINLKLPVMAGASQVNLKIGAGWMKETTAIGEKGNTAIAAHRSYTRGRFFNRLDEVAVGDEIVIVKDGQELKYSVFNVVVVEPTDVSVLRGKKSEEIVTLITCTPIKVATHRLIVQAKRQP